MGIFRRKAIMLLQGLLPLLSSDFSQKLKNEKKVQYIEDPYACSWIIYFTSFME
jgi:hypothetical protein